MKKWTVPLVSALISFALFWGSGILPKITAGLVARAHMDKGYTYLFTEYSPAHDMYMCYFEGENGEDRHLGVVYRYFPFFVLYDSFYPG